MNSTSSHNLADSQVRVYDRTKSVVFLRTKDSFGGLSNMAGGYSLCVNDAQFRTSEALYQACRFPHFSEIQKLIIDAPSPMIAKAISKHNMENSRADWMRVRVRIMRWCLRVKLIENWHSFGSLLLETNDKPIVELSFKDSFWGAKPVDKFKLVGMNVLGRLLMELREEVNSDQHDSLLQIHPVQIPDFILLGAPINTLIGDKKRALPLPNSTKTAIEQITLFDQLA